MQSRYKSKNKKNQLNDLKNCVINGDRKAGHKVNQYPSLYHEIALNVWHNVTPPPNLNVPQLQSHASSLPHKKSTAK